jgi:hypothetical protein
VSGDLVGRAVNAVLLPPQAERFASLVGVELDRLVLNVSGWNKLVLVDSERVFLFPRAASGVEWFERELAVYRALDPATCASAATEAAGGLGRRERAQAWRTCWPGPPSSPRS